MRVVWNPAARKDLLRITDWLEQRSATVAYRTNLALRAAARTLTVFPERGRRGQVLDTRELWSVPPTVLVYEVDAEAGIVRILRIWHGAQDRTRPE